MNPDKIDIFCIWYKEWEIYSKQNSKYEYPQAKYAIFFTMFNKR